MTRERRESRAKAFTDGLPLLSGSDGKFAVEIVELMPM
jgi:hypothetical protein